MSGGHQRQLPAHGPAQPDVPASPSLGLRRDVARVIRSDQPDAVLVTSWDVEFVAGLNQADHWVAGLAALDAVPVTWPGLPAIRRRGS